MKGWVRSSFCDSGACVQVRLIDEAVYLRDSKLKDASPILVYGISEWEDFLDDICLDAEETLLDMQERGGAVQFSQELPDRFLSFDYQEYLSFFQGIKVGEFEIDHLRQPPSVEELLQFEDCRHG